MALSDFDLVFFGGSGDLAMRKLLPAMYARDVCNDLPATARIICVGRDEMSQEAFIEMVETNAKSHVKENVDAGAWQTFLDRITYVAVDAGNVATYAALAEALRKDPSLTRVYYLATPPQLFATICENLAAVGLATLLLIGALACYALWLIGLALRSSGYRIEFGSRKKAATALSVISLARWWAAENPLAMLSRRQLQAALALLRSMALAVWI